MVRLPPARSSVMVLLVPGVIAAAIAVAVTWSPGPVASVPSASPGGATSLSASGQPTAAPASPTAWPYPPLPIATQRSCILPTSLPTPEAPIATPAVSSNGVSLLFSSPLYARGRNGALEALDDPENGWAIGLWYQETDTQTPRLLAASMFGMVMPLALSPSGAFAAVWWLPDRRPTSEPDCDSGIYLLSTRTGESHLVVEGNWTDVQSAEDVADEVGGVLWNDPTTGRGTAHPYRLPEASFSADDHFLTLVDRSQISIYENDASSPRWTHAGACPNWAWSPVGAEFVAGCDDMTTAWIVDASEPNVRSLALPWLATQARATGWGDTAASAIGLNRDSSIRLVGFFGFATECVASSPCPKPAYTIVTVDPVTSTAATRSATLDFLVEQTVGYSPKFSADASWVYIEGFTREGRLGAATLHATTGGLTAAVPPEAFVGAAWDGTALFGSRTDDAVGDVVITSLNAAGRTSRLGTIHWAAGATGSTPTIGVIGLTVVAAGS